MSVLFATADAARIPLADRSVDFVFGSPPYCDARTYGIGAQRGAAEWVEWMLRVTTEALRVSLGAVVWVCAGVTRDRNYWPACEGLAWEWFKRGGHAYRPCYWHRIGIPGSGGDQWFRADVEYCLAFKRPGPLPWADNTAMGNPPKWASGGAMSNRKADGSRKGWNYVPPPIANPGNVIRNTVGSGNLGHPLAHENEAPFPESLAEWWIKSLCPPGGTVADPFSGSGTTACVADRLGRRGVGFDLRRSQCELGRKRHERPHAKRKPARAKAERWANPLGLEG